jgi:hypothetical protein
MLRNESLGDLSSTNCDAKLQTGRQRARALHTFLYVFRHAAHDDCTLLHRHVWGYGESLYGCFFAGSIRGRTDHKRLRTALHLAAHRRAWTPGLPINPVTRVGFIDGPTSDAITRFTY